MSRRFSVEVAPDSFHVVGADEMRTNGGALEFWINGELSVVYAPAAYISATFDYDESENSNE